MLTYPQRGVPELDFHALERSVLKAILTDKHIFGQLRPCLEEYQWTEPFCRFFFRVAQKIWLRHGEIPSRATLIDSIRGLQSDHRERAVHALAYVEAIAPAKDPHALVDILRGRQAKEAAIETHLKAAELLEKGKVGEAVDIMRRANVKQAVQMPKRLTEGGWRPKAPKVRIPTGIWALDELIGGFAFGELNVISARPGVGKSTACNEFAWSATVHQRRVLWLDTENGEDLTKARFLARATGIPASLIESDACSPLQTELLDLWMRRRGEHLDELLRVDEIGMSETTVADVEAKIEALDARGWPVECLIIDNPDHLKPDGLVSQRRADNDGYFWLGPLYQWARNLVRRYKIVGVFTSQINVHKGTLAGSQEKKNIPQVAIHIEVGEDPETGKPSTKGHRKIQIHKNRSGPGAQVELDAMADLAVARILAFPSDEVGDIVF
jgi:replicative DNA helicase